MFREYVTALVISYEILIGGEPRVVDSVTYFQNAEDCQQAFQHEDLGEILYAHLRRTYGKRMMMSCEPTNVVSKAMHMHIPPPRPKILED